MLIDLILILSYLAIAITLAVTSWAVYLSIRHSRHTDGSLHGIPVRRNAIIIAISVIVLLMTTFIIGSSEPLKVNGETYTDVFWIKASNMFVVCSVLLIVITALTTSYAFWRKLPKRKK